MSKQYFTIIIFLLLGGRSLTAQDRSSTLGHLPSPQAADLGQFGDIPVSYYTGRADITIPIQNFVKNDVALDINLTYDTSGLPLNKLPGWTGPGWSLHAGGVITRVQNFWCDEMSYTNRDYLDCFSNYFHSFGGITNPDGSLNLPYTINSDADCNDYSPDYFYFNFMGKTGSFFLGNDGYWKVRSESNLVVEFDYADTANFVTPLFETFPSFPGYKHPKAIKGFTIYDDQGNQYIFGGNNLSIEYSVDLFRTSIYEQWEPWVATAWYLTHVRDRFDNELYTFTYDEGHYLVQLYRTPLTADALRYSGTLTRPVYLDSIMVANEVTIKFTMSSPYPAGEAAKNLYPSMYESTGAPKTLLPGETPGICPFYYLQHNTQDALRYSVLSHPIANDPLASMDIKFLDEIAITRNGIGPSIRYKLDYSDAGRRHLSSLSAVTSSGTLYHYNFKYNDYTSLPSDYLLTQHDYWGYYNRYYYDGWELQPLIPQDGGLEGGGSGSGGTPATPAPKDSVYKADLVTSLMGMLHEIIYPTGGKTVLAYELNDYSKVQARNYDGAINKSGTAGGLRVRLITEYEDSMGIKKVRQRTFSYVDPNTGNSSGQLMENEGLHNYFIVESGVDTTSFSIPVVPLGTKLGTHIGYSYVTETVEGFGSRLYRFSNLTDLDGGTGQLLPPDPPEADPYENEPQSYNPDFKRGKILEETVMDANGEIQQHRKYSYRTDAGTYMSQVSYGFNNGYYINASFISPPGQNVVPLYYAKYDPARIILSTRYGDQMIADTTYYTMTTFDNLMVNWQTKPYFRKCVQEKTARGTFSHKKAYVYHSSSADKYFIPLSSTSVYEGTKLQHTDNVIYGLCNGHDQPFYETTQLASGPIDTLVTYQSYTTSGFPESFTRKGEYPTRLFWNDNGRLLASVTSPYPASQLTCTEYIRSIPLPGFIIGHEYSPMDVIQKGGRSIFEFPDVKAVANIYYKDGRLFMTSTGTGNFQFYYYDELGRLKEIRDQKDKVLQHFTYHFSTTSAQ